jgi:hypothetical protein
MAIATRLGAAAPTQWTLAQDENLRTESEGNTPDRIVIRDVLNRELRTDHYQVRWVSNPPTALERTLFADDLLRSIDTGWPIVATFLVRPGGPRPAGYPLRRDDEIRHIVTIHGYTDAGAGVLVADPASGASAVTWSDDLPPVYELPIDLAVDLMAEKGYVA